MMYLIGNQILIGFSIGGLVITVVLWIKYRKCYTPPLWILLLIIIGLSAASNIYRMGNC